MDPGRRTEADAERVPLTHDEAAELTRLFATELARGWVPTEHDLRDALGALHAASRRPPASPRARSLVRDGERAY